MYKYILLLIMAFIMSSCTELVKRKDQYHEAPFENIIKKGDIDIVIYDVYYPDQYSKKLKFYDDFYNIIQKMLLYKSTINIMYSEKLKSDMDYLKKYYILPEEDAFLKSSSDLSQIDRKNIDKTVKIDIPKELGTTQYYLNKQIYFLEGMLKNRNNFSKSKIYTELDKENMIQKIKDQRKKMFIIMEEIYIDKIVSIDKPYQKNKKGYWQAKDVYINSDTNLNYRIFKKQEYIYLNNITNLDTKKILSGELKFDSKVIIVKNRLYNGYTILNGKYIFLYNGQYSINYYNGYRINIKIKQIFLNDLLKKNSKFLINDFLYPQNYKKRQGK